MADLFHWLSSSSYFWWIDPRVNFSSRFNCSLASSDNVLLFIFILGYLSSLWIRSVRLTRSSGSFEQRFDQSFQSDLLFVRSSFNALVFYFTWNSSFVCRFVVLRWSKSKRNCRCEENERTNEVEGWMGEGKERKRAMLDVDQWRWKSLKWKGRQMHGECRMKEKTRRKNVRDSAGDFSLFLVLHFGPVSSHFEQKKKKYLWEENLPHLIFSSLLTRCSFVAKPIFTNVFSSHSSLQIRDHCLLSDHFPLPSISIPSIETNETSSLAFVVFFTLAFIFVGIGIEKRDEETIIRSVERLRRDRRDIGLVFTFVCRTSPTRNLDNGSSTAVTFSTVRLNVWREFVMNEEFALLIIQIIWRSNCPLSVRASIRTTIVDTTTATAMSDFGDLPTIYDEAILYPVPGEWSFQHFLDGLGPKLSHSHSYVSAYSNTKVIILCGAPFDRSVKEIWAMLGLSLSPPRWAFSHFVRSLKAWKNRVASCSSVASRRSPPVCWSIHVERRASIVVFGIGLDWCTGPFRVYWLIGRTRRWERISFPSNERRATRWTAPVWFLTRRRSFNC